MTYDKELSKILEFWKLEDGKIVRDDEAVIYDQYVCKWDEENSTFYIEFYYNICSLEYLNQRTNWY